MRYSHSSLDRKNLGWFQKDPSRATLLTIRILRGKIRALENLQVDFSYPITAIAGRNRSGKTTLLAIAACAFHNNSNGFRLQGRKNSYYTFSDFFVQTSEEVPIAGIRIDYQILHDNWYSSKLPYDKVGPNWQARIKPRFGRWNNYERRVNRTVVFFGIDRIVPNAERSVSKSYRRLFRPAGKRGWEENVKEVVGRILGVDYDDFGHKVHSKYRLPIVKAGQQVYSGFNMGAGEESLFELFSVINECPDGSLIIIDEIELGLHEEAQEKLINELKAICEKRKFQIICTTHSARILDCLPPEGRVFLERFGRKTQAITGISSAYATGKMSGRPKTELDILVEDDAAKLILETSFTPELRHRIRIIHVGSAAAVMRHLAARYKENSSSEICVLLDGDKSSSTQTQINEFLKALETHKNEAEKDAAKAWAQSRIDFLPGKKWPEHWIVSHQDDDTLNRLSKEFCLPPEKMEDILKASRRAGKHNEFYEAARRLNFDKKIVAHQLIKIAFESLPDERQRLITFVQNFLH